MTTPITPMSMVTASIAPKQTITMTFQCPTDNTKQVKRNFSVSRLQRITEALTTAQEDNITKAKQIGFWDNLIDNICVMINLRDITKKDAINKIFAEIKINNDNNNNNDNNSSNINSSSGGGNKGNNDAKKNHKASANNGQSAINKFIILSKLNKLLDSSNQIKIHINHPTPISSSNPKTTDRNNNNYFPVPIHECSNIQVDVKNNTTPLNHTIKNATCIETDTINKFLELNDQIKNNFDAEDVNAMFNVVCIEKIITQLKDGKISDIKRSAQNPNIITIEYYDKKENNSNNDYNVDLNNCKPETKDKIIKLYEDEQNQLSTNLIKEINATINGDNTDIKTHTNRGAESIMLSLLAYNSFNRLNLNNQKLALTHFITQEFKHNVSHTIANEINRIKETAESIDKSEYSLNNQATNVIDGHISSIEYLYFQENKLKELAIKLKNIEDELNNVCYKDNKSNANQLIKDQISNWKLTPIDKKRIHDILSSNNNTTKNIDMGTDYDAQLIKFITETNDIKQIFNDYTTNYQNNLVVAIQTIEQKIVENSNEITRANLITTINNYTYDVQKSLDDAIFEMLTALKIMPPSLQLKSQNDIKKSIIEITGCNEFQYKQEITKFEQRFKAQKKYYDDLSEQIKNTINAINTSQIKSDTNYTNLTTTNQAYIDGILDIKVKELNKDKDISSILNNSNYFLRFEMNNENNSYRYTLDLNLDTIKSSIKKATEKSLNKNPVLSDKDEELLNNKIGLYTKILSQLPNNQFIDFNNLLLEQNNQILTISDLDKQNLQNIYTQWSIDYFSEKIKCDTNIAQYTPSEKEYLKNNSHVITQIILRNDTNINPGDLQKLIGEFKIALE